MELHNPLLSRWGAAIDKSCPWAEYPRPQQRRQNWQCLNGIWHYAIRSGTETTEPEQYDGEILVPFSPESLLSGVGRQLLPGQVLWYRREFNVNGFFGGDALMEKLRLLLHFGAVDQCCKVFINGSLAGNHEGGYWPFALDISGLIRTGTNTLTVEVTDNSDTGCEAYGKQKLKRGGIWYTAQSGIWQTVWLEIVPELYITQMKINPRCETSEVEFSFNFSLPQIPPVRVRIFGEDALISEGSFELSNFRLPVPDFRSWSPDDPFLYTAKISAGSDDIETYFGMRQFGIIRGSDNLPRLSLNGKAIFHSGLLDQGYWSDGLYTAPSDEAMVWELGEVKRLGFNMLRKHIKIEPLRWYYHCDRLGILVWQDFVNGGGPYSPFVTQYLPFIGVKLHDRHGRRGFGRRSRAGRDIFEHDMARTVDLLGNVTSLAVWTLFNEGWGQFDARRLTDMLHVMDNTRLVDHASGWHDQQYGDFASHHVYYKPFRYRQDRLGRIQALTEFGGYSLPSKGHMASQKLFGYRRYRDKDSFGAALRRLYESEVFPVKARGLSAAVYTQLSDVEDEINGLYTYDRAELKIDPAVIQELNRDLISGTDKLIPKLC